MNLICCPTYKRENPFILQLVNKYPNDTFNFFIRSEEYFSAIYNDGTWNNDNVKLIELQHCTNIGNTRAKIIDYCKQNSVKYCLMLDDSVSDIISLSGKNTISEIIDDIVKNEIMTDSLSKNIAAVKIPVRKPRRNKEGEKTYSSSLYRAVLIDIEKISEKKLNYIDSNLSGHEDFVFAYELHMNGLCSIVSERCKVKGRPCLPDRTENGGTHLNSDTKTVENETNTKSEKSIQYLTEKYGSNKNFKSISKFMLSRRDFTISCLHAFFKKEEILKNE